MIKKLYLKHETPFCIGLIILYVVLNSLCLQNYETIHWQSAVINLAFCAALAALTLHLNKTAFYGLTRVRNAKACLYFLPLAVIASVNLWGGVRVQNTAAQILCHVIMMLCVGFIEEMIFRGYLFRMMEKDNLRLAMVVSALTFGIGHIVNLLNGEPLVPTLLQLCYATAIGWLFVVLFRKTGSLWPCIITHGVLNALSIFNVENDRLLYIASALLIVVSLGYAEFVRRSGNKEEGQTE